MLWGSENDPRTLLICGRPARGFDAILGPYCSQVHLAKPVEEERRLHAEILAEPAEPMPELLCDEDVDRLTLKIALLILAALPPEEKARQRRNGRWILPPEQMAEAIKVSIVKHLPARYRSCSTLHGTARVFFSQTFGVSLKIPRDVLRKALEKLNSSTYLDRRLANYAHRIEAFENLISHSFEWYYKIDGRSSHHHSEQDPGFIQKAS